MLLYSVLRFFHQLSDQSRVRFGSDEIRVILRNNHERPIADLVGVDILLFAVRRCEHHYLDIISEPVLHVSVVLQFLCLHPTQILSQHSPLVDPHSAEMAQQRKLHVCIPKVVKVVNANVATNDALIIVGNVVQVGLHWFAVSQSQLECFGFVFVMRVKQPRQLLWRCLRVPANPKYFRELGGRGLSWGQDQNQWDEDRQFCHSNNRFGYVNINDIWCQIVLINISIGNDVTLQI